MGLKIGILYNIVTKLERGHPADIIAEQDILNTVKGVSDVLKTAGHEVIPIVVDKELYEKTRTTKLDIIFNLGEGIGGNITAEAYIPAILEMAGIPYTGSNFLTLSVCLDKAKTKQILLSNDIPTPKFQVFKAVDEQLELGMKFPLIVKPVHEDASIGITNDSVVMDEQQMRSRIKYVLETYRQPAMVEEFIEGREVNVSIIGNREPVALPIEELDFKDLPNGTFNICSYQAKWMPETEIFKKTVPICPADIPKHVENRVKRLALAAYKIMECQDYARIDIRIDKNNNPYLLEVNPNPDIGQNDTAFSRAANAAGMDYNQLVLRILQEALERQALAKRVEEKLNVVQHI